MEEEEEEGDDDPASTPVSNFEQRELSIIQRVSHIFSLRALELIIVCPRGMFLLEHLVEEMSPA